MVSGILGQVTGVVEKRFLLNALFPTLVFAIVLGLAVAAGAEGVGDALDTWEKQSGNVQVFLAIGGVSVIFVGANLLANGTLGIIRLYEGYAPPAVWFARWARNYQHRRAGKVITRDQDEFELEYPVYPRNLTPEDVAPTRLGNVLRSAETYPLDRYGLDTVRLWPRLYLLLPEGLVTSMAEARASMEFLLVFAFLSTIYVPLAGIYLLVVAGPATWFIGSLVGGAGLALIAYRGSLGPASVYCTHVRAAVDLHRFELLESIRVPVPATIDEEKRTWTEVTAFLERGRKPIWRFAKAK